jgi:exodeoxyribonuclease VII large subunit
LRIRVADGAISAAALGSQALANPIPAQRVTDRPAPASEQEESS